MLNKNGERTLQLLQFCKFFLRQMNEQGYIAEKNLPTLNTICYK